MWVLVLDLSWVTWFLEIAVVVATGRAARTVLEGLWVGGMMGGPASDHRKPRRRVIHRTTPREPRFVSQANAFKSLSPRSSTKLHHASALQPYDNCIAKSTSALPLAHPRGTLIRTSWGPLLQPSGEAVVQLIGLTGLEVGFGQSVVRFKCVGSDGQGGHASATADCFRRGTHSCL